MAVTTSDVVVDPAPQELSGVQKAAVLILHLGTEHSAKVLRSMRDSEVELVMGEIARLGSVSSDTVDSVLTEFQELAQARRYYSRGGIEFAREVLQESLGAERAGQILERLQSSLVEMPFQFLRRADPQQVLSFLQDEHPQTITLVLAHMPAGPAAAVLSALPEDLQADVAHRLALMDRTSPEVVRQVETVLERKLSSVLQSADYAQPGGLQLLVDIINHSDRGTERLILDGLERRDPALAEEVRSHMFVFEDIVNLDDRSVQVVLRQVDTKDLATALKGVRADVRDKVMRNLSQRAATNLTEEIELLGPVRLRAVEEAQGQIVQAIRALEEAGQITVSRGERDEFVV